MKRGIVIGKFYPVHVGHSYLIDTAAAAVDELVVIVCDRYGQLIPADMRAEWIRTIHPDVTVIVVPDIELDDDSETWASYTILCLGYTPDVVFTSEDYGFDYALQMGCEHVLVDKQRTTFPISATMVRHNPFAVWEYLHPIVRSYFVKRVCVLGAESTGTTTLAKDLAEYYDTVWVPEYGRLYSEALSCADEQHVRWTDDDFEHIASIQSSIEDMLVNKTNKVLICDTNALATTLWQQRYMEHMTNNVSQIAEQRKNLYDLYILTGDEIPFVQDGLRDGEHIRHDMHETFESVLQTESVPYVVVRGTRQERLEQAVQYCDRLLQNFDMSIQRH